jgi:NRPS condensation-like uncharacterized protein
MPDAPLLEKSAIHYSIWKTLSVKKLLQGVGLADIGIVDRQEMLFSGTGNNLDRTVTIDTGHLPVFVNHIMIMLTVLKGIYLPGSRAWRYGAFGFVVND